MTTEKEKSKEEPKKEQEKPISEMTDEELEAQSNAFLKVFYPDAPGPASTETSSDKKAAEEKKVEPEKEGPSKEEPQKAEDDKKVADEPQKKPEPAVEISDFSDAKISRMRKQEPEAPKKQEKSDDDGLTAKERKYISVLGQMEKLDSKYKGLAQQHINYLVKEAQYIKKWLQEHPDEEYDAQDEEHKAFYDRYEPSYDQDDFDEAAESLISEKATKAAKDLIREEMTKSEQKRLLQESTQQINATAYRGVLSFIEQADPDLGAILEKDERGNKFATEKTLKAMEEADGLAYDILFEESEPLSYMIGEIERFSLLPGIYKPDLTMSVRLKGSGREFLVHKEVVKFLIEHEAQQLALPSEETMRNGKTLVANQVFRDEVDRILNKKEMSEEQKNEVLRDIDKRYYTLSYEDYRNALIASTAKKAKEKIEKLRQRSGGTKAIKKESGKEDSSKEEEIQKPQSQRTKPPNTATTSERTDTKGKQAKTAEDIGEEIVDRMFGRVG